MKLGAFSISLAVKDLKKSQHFYENLGFVILAGSHEKNYFILKNEDSLIGLFQGMFEENIITFNPGWDTDGNNLEEFDDIRKIQKHLRKHSTVLETVVDESTTGPGNLLLKDPDGNLIMLDQHR